MQNSNRTSARGRSRTRTRSPRGKSALATVPLLLFAALFVGACKADHEGLNTVTVQQLAVMRKNDASLVVVDANGTSTRSEYGVIPGAVLLSGGSSYDTAAELPATKDRPLVFYCASERCSAAPSAARRAQDAGFTEVFVLPAGIRGWVGAGMPVDKAPLG